MTIKQRVENILRASRQARNSDIELQIIYMQKSGMELTEKQIQTLKSLPAMETIRRIRQKLQEDGEYPPAEAVNEARYNKYKYVRSNIKSSNSPEKYLESNGYRVLPYGQ